LEDESKTKVLFTAAKNAVVVAPSVLNERSRQNAERSHAKKKLIDQAGGCDSSIDFDVQTKLELKNILSGKMDSNNNKINVKMIDNSKHLPSMMNRGKIIPIKLQNRRPRQMYHTGTSNYGNIGIRKISAEQTNEKSGALSDKTVVDKYAIQVKQIAPSITAADRSINKRLPSISALMQNMAQEQTLLQAAVAVANNDAASPKTTQQVETATSAVTTKPQRSCPEALEQLDFLMKPT